MKMASLNQFKTSLIDKPKRGWNFQLVKLLDGRLLGRLYWGGVTLLVSALSGLDRSQSCLAGQDLCGAFVCIVGYLSSVVLFLPMKEYSWKFG